MRIFQDKYKWGDREIVQYHKSEAQKFEEKDSSHSDIRHRPVSESAMEKEVVTVPVRPSR